MPVAVGSGVGTVCLSQDFCEFSEASASSFQGMKI